MSSILEVFAIQFETNAAKASQEVDEFGKSLDDVEERIDDSSEASDRLGESFFATGKLGRQALGVAATLGATFITLATQAANQLQLGRTAQFLAQDVESFHAMGEALKDLTGDAKDYENSLLNIRDRLQAIQMGDKGAQEAFLRLGIRVIDPATGQVRKPDEVFRDLFDRINASDNTQLAMTFGMEAGLTQATVNAAQRASMVDLDEIAERKRELYNITPADVENARKLAQASNDALLTISEIIQQFTREFGPEMTKFLTAFTSIMQDNMKLVNQVAKEMRSILNRGQSGADVAFREIEEEGFFGAAGNFLLSPIAALSAEGDKIRYERLNEEADAAFAKFLSAQNLPVNSSSFQSELYRSAVEATIEAPITIYINGDGTATNRQISESARGMSEALNIQIENLGAEFSTNTDK